jgi:hypothetical protein
VDGGVVVHDAVFVFGAGIIMDDDAAAIAGSLPTAAFVAQD